MQTPYLARSRNPFVSMSAASVDAAPIDAASLWPELDRTCAYINAASRTPLPACVLAAGEAAVRRKAATPWDIGDTEAQKEEVRTLFGELLGGGVSSRDVAVLPSCSFAMSVAAHNLRGAMRARPAGRRRVLVLEDQNPSNVMQWQALCDDEGGELLALPRPADGDWASALVAQVDSGSVAVAALPPCHWCDGAVVDLAVVGAACSARGVPLVVDATQWLGAAAPLEPARIGACFVACSVHKWLLGPYGACLCYAEPSFWRALAGGAACSRLLLHVRTLFSSKGGARGRSITTTGTERARSMWSAFRWARAATRPPSSPAPGGSRAAAGSPNRQRLHSPLLRRQEARGRRPAFVHRDAHAGRGAAPRRAAADHEADRCEARRDDQPRRGAGERCGREAAERGGREAAERRPRRCGPRRGGREES